MRPTLLQPWTTVQGAAALSTLTQSGEDWLDVSAHADSGFWIDVAQVTASTTGAVQLVLQSSPTRDETYFFPVTPPIALSPTSSGTPVLVKSVRVASTVPLTRFMRWQLQSTSSSDWSVTFRVRAGLSKQSFFAPTQLPGCVLWLRADLGAAFGAGEFPPVSAWADQSGSGNNLSQGTGSQQPSYKPTGGPNGQPALQFAGSSSQNLQTSTVVCQPASGVTVFLVQQVAVTTSFEISFCIGTGSTNGLYISLDGLGTNERDVAAGGVAVYSDGTATTSWEQWSVTCISGSQALRVNGAATSLSGTSAFIAATAGTFLGISGVGTLPMTGNVAEVIVYNSVLSATQILQVEAYLAGRYGI